MSLNLPNIRIPLYSGNPLMGTLANTEDPDEMQHNFIRVFIVCSYQKTPSGTDTHHNLENSTCDPLKYTIGSCILIVSIYMGKFTRIQRVIALKYKPDPGLYH